MGNELFGTCKLCHVHGPLQRKSHIYPNFLYQGLREEDGFFRTFTPVAQLRGVDDTRLRTTGYYDEGMLCRRCDGEVIGGYETYAANFIFAKNPSGIEVTEEKGPPGFSVTRLRKVDYVKLKLFILSLVWRAHHSKQVFFRDVFLGPYENAMREIILNGTHVPEAEFPVYCFGWRVGSVFPSDMVVEPVTMRIKQGHSYLLIFRGLIIWVKITPRAMDDAMMKEGLREDGSLMIARPPDHQLINFLGRAFGHRPHEVEALLKNARRRMAERIT